MRSQVCWCRLVSATSNEKSWRLRITQLAPPLSWSNSHKKPTHCKNLILTWDRILESIKAGKRLPETRFATMSMAPRAQSSVHKLYAKSTDEASGIDAQ